MPNVLVLSSSHLFGCEKSYRCSGEKMQEWERWVDSKLARYRDNMEMAQASRSLRMLILNIVMSALESRDGQNLYVF